MGGGGETEVVAVNKKGVPLFMRNYRLVRMLAAISEVFERICFDQ